MAFYLEGAPALRTDYSQGAGEEDEDRFSGPEENQKRR
jgi:hypothetical protein